MADTLDILTWAEFHHALNLVEDLSGELAEREQVITAASRMVDQIFGPVVQRTVTGELHDGGRDVIWPRQTPVVSVTSVTEYNDTTPTTVTVESNISKPSNGYMLESDRHNVSLRRRTAGSDYCWPSGRRNVAVTYVAGRYASTAAVDARFKEAAAEVAIHLWQARGAGSGLSTGDGVPFGGVPFSTDLLVKKLRSMLPDDTRPPWLA